jgi:acyl-CoA dehydrogenase
MSDAATAQAGMSFDFTEEQQFFRQSVRDFVNKECPKEKAREWEASEEFPWDLWNAISKAGLHGVGVPEEYGGQGGGIIDQMIVAEELARTLAGLTWAWGITSFSGAKSVGLYGTEEQKRRYLPDMVEGRNMFAISLTEPHGGTDVLGAMRTRARKVDGGWVVNGTKIWSTCAHVADTLLLIARTRTDVEKPSDGITAFLCDAKAEGVRATPIPKLGMRCIASCEVQLDDVFIPEENVLGEVDRGWRQLVATLNNERIMVAALCTGVLQGVLEDAVRYAQEREAFGKPIGQFQAIQHKIADMQILLETAKLHTYRAAWLQSQGRPCGVESTMAKIVASEAAVQAADMGIQILGGYGYAMEYDMQRYWRDVRLYRIGPITNEMGRNYIGEQLGLPRSF